MKIEVTHKVIERMIERSKRNFLRSSSFSYEMKKLVSELHVFVIFNERLKTAAGQANTLTRREAEKMPALDKRIKKFYIDYSRKFLIIEINKKFAQRRSTHELFDTVSHELAHCVDFVIRGHISRKNRWHDKFWREIHQAMGGSGKATY